MPVVLLLLLFAGVKHSLAAPHMADKLNSDKACVGCHPASNPHLKFKGKECTPCHIESGEKQLRNHFTSWIKGNKPCLECHDIKEDKENIKSMHPGTNARLCGMCHKPENYPIKMLPIEKQMSLCSECHNRNQLTQAETITGTNFRDGSKNLHYIHSEDLYHIRCNNCHDAHHSKQLYLIRSSGSK